MFNQTNAIIGSIYAVSAVVGGSIVLAIVKLTSNETRIAKTAGKKASASTSEYLQEVYRKRVDDVLEIIDSSEVSDETKAKLLGVVDNPL